MNLDPLSIPGLMHELAEKSWSPQKLLEWHHRQLIVLENPPHCYLDAKKTLSRLMRLWETDTTFFYDRKFFDCSKKILHNIHTPLYAEFEDQIIHIHRYIFRKHFCIFPQDRIPPSLNYTLRYFSEALEAFDTQAIAQCLPLFQSLNSLSRTYAQSILIDNLKKIEKYFVYLASSNQERAFNELFDFLHQYQISWNQVENPHWNQLSRPLFLFNPFRETQADWEKILKEKDYLIVESIHPRFPPCLYLRLKQEIYQWIDCSYYENKAQIKQVYADFAKQVFAHAKSKKTTFLKGYPHMQLCPTVEQLRKVLEKTSQLGGLYDKKSHLKFKFKILFEKYPNLKKTIPTVFQKKQRSRLLIITKFFNEYLVSLPPRQHLLEHADLENPLLHQKILEYGILKHRPKLLRNLFLLNPDLLNELNQDPLKDYLSFAILYGKIEMASFVLNLGLKTDKETSTYGTPLLTLLKILGFYFSKMGFWNHKMRGRLISDETEIPKSALIPFKIFLYNFCQSQDPSLNFKKIFSEKNLPSIVNHQQHLAVFAKKVAKIQLALDPTKAYKVLLETHHFLPELAYEILEQNPALIKKLDCDTLHEFIHASLFADWKIKIPFLQLDLYSSDKFSLEVFFPNLNHVNKKQILSSHQIQEILEVLTTFLKNGIDPNKRFNTTSSGEIDYFPLEYCYYENMIAPTPLWQEIAMTLLAFGATITARMALHLKYQIKIQKDSPFIPDLIKQNHLSQQELALLLQDEALLTEPLEQLTYRLNEGILFIEKELYIHHLNPFLISYEKVQALRDLKKKAKQFLLHQPAPDLKNLYDRFSRKYTTLVLKHPFLCELRKISQCIRSWTTLKFEEIKVAPAAYSFYAYWGPDQSYSIDVIKQRFFQLIQMNRQDTWNDLYRKALAAAQSFQGNTSLANTPIVWLHGTKSSSLPSILKSEALIPMGMLLENNEGIPLSGEICGADNHINKEHLSGEALSKDFSDLPHMFDNAATRLLVNFLYASKHEGYWGLEHNFSPETAWKQVQIPFLKTILPQSINAWHDPWSPLKVNILRLRLTDPEADKKLAEFKEYVDSELLKDPDHKNLKQIQKNLSSPLPFQLRKDDHALINNPYPLIFASTTAKTEYRHNQFLAQGKLALGENKDIPYLFTSPKYVEDLKTRVQSLGIKVFDFDTAFYLEALNMIRGENVKAIENFTLVRRISYHLQDNLLPFYATPFPKNPSYFDIKSGKRIELSHPLFHEYFKRHDAYLEAINHQHILPRNTHGAMHACRTTLWTQLLLGLYQQAGVDVSGIDPLLLALTGASHDIAREDEGLDLWDEASAKFLKGFLQNLGYDQEIIPPYGHAIAEKDPPNHRFTSAIQQIVHDADVLEINRCILAKDFKKDFLCFYHFPNLSSEKKEWIIEEVQSFIALTEIQEIKHHLEWESENYYLDLVEILKNKKDDYPFLSLLLSRIGSV